MNPRPSGFPDSGAWRAVQTRRTASALRALLLLLLLLLLLVVLSPAAPLARGEDAASVESFVALRDKWPRLQGASLTVEGRWSVFTEDRLLLTNCSDLVFLFAEGVRPPTVKTKNVEVTGQLETSEGKLVFRVSRLKLLPADIDAVRARRAAIQTNQAEEWYELGKWTAQRARFYDDDVLRTEAATLNKTGLMIEYRKIGPDDVQPLYGLAEQAAALGLPSRLGDQFVHEALRRELKQAHASRQFDTVLTHILEKLPGSGVPQDQDEAALAREAAYRRDPLAAYEAADDAERLLLHRTLYAEAVLDQIETDAAADGRNGFAIAERLERVLPEYAARAEEHRRQEIAFQIEHIAQIGRADLQELAGRLEARGQAARAEEVKGSWLVAHEEAFRAGGVTGRFDLADEYLRLLGDERRAARMYMEIYETGEGQEAARTRLLELGYRYDGKQWELARTDAEDALADAIRQGIVRRGMTDEQVRAALGAAPSSIVRFATRGDVSELWVYLDHGVSIRFTRRSAGSPRVATDITDLGELAAP